MLAPTYSSALTPVEPYNSRFAVPGGQNLGNTVGRMLVTGGAELDHLASVRAAVQAMSDDTAGRARALQDGAALTGLADNHGTMLGGAAVAAQPQALDQLARIRAEGQTALGTPGMIAAYDQQLGPVMEHAASRITSHALQQSMAERQAVADQTMQTAQQSAAGAWQDPMRFIHALGTVQAIATGQTGIQASDADRVDAVRTATGGAVAGAIGQALAAGEPEFAAHIVSSWGDTLSPAAYQLAVARLGQAIRSQRMANVFAQAAGGNPQGRGTDTPVPPESPDTVAITAPAGAAIHPIAGGTVSALDGSPDNAAVHIVHPDGSRTVYGGLGLAHVAPGDQVSPAHVIGSASPLVTLATTTPSGNAADAAALLRDAGGAGAMVGATTTPRSWDVPTMLDRIAGMRDLSPADQTTASALAHRRMAADAGQQAAADQAAGRSVISLVAAAPDSIAHAADLPSALAAQMTPATLAQVDGALRNAASSPGNPAPDNPAALRLELMQRQVPGAFAQINLAPLIGTIHPANLSQLAANQSDIAAGQPVAISQDRRAAVLDALARHEFASGTSLPDAVLPLIKDRAETALRIGQADNADRAATNGAVADAIQMHLGRP